MNVRIHEGLGCVGFLHRTAAADARAAAGHAGAIHQGGPMACRSGPRRAREPAGGSAG